MSITSTSITAIRKEKAELIKPYCDRIKQLEKQIYHEMDMKQTDTIIDGDTEIKKVKVTRNLTTKEKESAISTILSNAFMTPTQAEKTAKEILESLSVKKIIDKNKLLVKPKDIK